MTNLKELASALAHDEARIDEKWTPINDKTASYIDDYGYLDAIAGASANGKHVWIEKLLGLEGAQDYTTKRFIGKYIITIRQYHTLHAYACDEL